MFGVRIIVVGNGKIYPYGVGIVPSLNVLSYIRLRLLYSRLGLGYYKSLRCFRIRSGG